MKEDNAEHAIFHFRRWRTESLFESPISSKNLGESMVAEWKAIEEFIQSEMRRSPAEIVSSSFEPRLAVKLCLVVIP